MRSLLLALVLLVAGCGAAPTKLPELEHPGRVVQLGAPFQVSRANRYAIVLKAATFAPPTRPCPVLTAEDMLAGVRVVDPFIDADADQLSDLLVAKNFLVFRGDMGSDLPADVWALIARIGAVSTDSTQLFFAYTGEGDAIGLRTRSFMIGPHRRLVTPEVTITPAELFAALVAVRGRTAVLLNACESGVFAQAAAQTRGFNGVVVAACPVGYATTPHEPTGTSAIFAAFLELYRDDSRTRINLATVAISRAGGLWTNLAHHVVNLWSGSGRAISYEPVTYVSADFML